MPTYVYQCQNCEARFERVTLIANRKDATKEPCKECSQEKIELAAVAPGIGDPVNLSVTRTPEWFTDRLKDIKKRYPGSTIKTDNTLGK